MLEKLKSKWGIQSNFQAVLILIVFSLAGSSVVFLRKAWFQLLGFDATTQLYVKVIAYILFIFPAYQLLLLFYGTLLGQFRFFWEKEKMMFRALTRWKSS